MSCFIYLTALLTALFCAVVALPNFSLYNNGLIEGSTFGMQLWGDRPDLAATAKYFPNTTYSFCCVTGIWAIYYFAENYGTNAVFQRDSCVRFGANPWVGSARVVGEVGEQRLNLYFGTYYRHNATVLTSSQPTVSTKFESMALVGNTSVQLYTLPNYGGASYCLPAQNTSYNVLADIASIGLEAGVIRSIRFGCALNANTIEVLVEESVHVQLSVDVE